MTKVNSFLKRALREKCPYLEFFWSIFSCIWTEYRKTFCTFPYSVQIRENTYKKNPNTDIFHTVVIRQKLNYLASILNCECNKILLTLLMSPFLAKKSAFLRKIVPLLKVIVWELCSRFFSSVFGLCKIKSCY